MDYEDLRRYQRMERNSASLADLDPDFYTKLNNLIQEFTRNYEATRSINDVKTLENIKKIALDIFERREQKLVIQSLKCVRNNEEDTRHLVEYERSTFQALCKEVRAHRESFERLLVGENTVIAEKTPETTVSEDLNMVLVRILKDIPKFVSSNMTELGPFEANQIKRLPIKEATILTDKQFAEII